MKVLFITFILVIPSHVLFSVTAYAREPVVQVNKNPEVRPTYGINMRLYEKLESIEQLFQQETTGSSNEHSSPEHAALEQFQTLLTQCKDCNPYELATLHRYIAWFAFETGDYRKSLQHFENIVSLSPEIPVDFELAALLALAKIYYQEEDFDSAWKNLSAWQKLAVETPAEIFELAARIQYFRGNTHSALTNMQTAISLEEAEGKIAAEAWYLFARSLLYEKEDFAACLSIQRKLVTHYSSDAHWRDLAIFYGLSGDSKNQLAAFDTAWMLDGLIKEADILNFSWLLQNAGYPYKAASILEHAMQENRIAYSKESLELSARAWYLAEEQGRAIANLESATSLGADGNLLVFLSELYMEADLYEPALKHLNQALKYGELKHPGRAYLTKGIAHLQLTQFREARQAFEKALHIKSSADIAARWLAQLEHEERRHQQLQLSIR